MDITQERADFEAFASKHGLCVTEEGGFVSQPCRGLDVEGMASPSLPAIAGSGGCTNQTGSRLPNKPALR